MTTLTAFPSASHREESTAMLLQLCDWIVARCRADSDDAAALSLHPDMQWALLATAEYYSAKAKNLRLVTNPEAVS